MWSFPQLLVVPADGPVEIGRRACRLRQDQAGRAELRLAGQRQRRASARRDVLAATSAPPWCMCRIAGRGRPRSTSRPAGSISCSSPMRRCCRSISPARCASSPCRRPSASTRCRDVPTMAEAGFPGLEMDTWFGLLAPAGTPAPIVGKLHDGVRPGRARAARSPGRWNDQGAEAVTNTPQEFAAYIACGNRAVRQDRQRRSASRASEPSTAATSCVIARGVTKLTSRCRAPVTDGWRDRPRLTAQGERTYVFAGFGR